MLREHILLLIYVTFQGITRTVTFPLNAKALQDGYGVPEKYTTAQGMTEVLSKAIIEILQNKKENEN